MTKSQLIDLLESGQMEWIADGVLSPHILEQAVMESISGFVLTDLEGTLLFANKTLALQFGYETIEEMVGKTVKEMLDDVEGVHQIIKRLLAQGQIMDELTGIRKDGSRFPILFSAKVIQNPDNTPEFLMGTLVDITELKLSQELSKTREDQFVSILDSFPIATTITRLDDGLFLYANAPARTMMKITPEDFGVKNALNNYANREQREVLLQEIREKGQVVDWESRHKTADGRTLTRMRTVRMITFQGVEALLSFTSDLTAQRNTVEDLEANRQLVHTIFNSIPIGISVKNAEGRYLMVNDSFCEIYDIPREAAIGKTFRELNRSDEKHMAVVEADEKLVLEEGKEINHERIRVSIPGKGIRWRRTQKKPFRDSNDQIIGLITVIEDITQKEVSEVMLQANQRLLQTVFDAIPHWIMVKDNESRYAMVNRAVAETYQMDPGAFIGVSTLEGPLGTVEERESFIARDQEVMRSNEPKKWQEVRVTNPDGEVRFRNITKIPLKDNYDNVTGLVALSEDITGQVQARRELEESRLRYQTLTRLSPVGIFRLDPGGHCVFVNEKWREFSGLTEAEAMGDGWRNAIHMEDSERVLREVEDALAGKKSFQSEFRFQTPRGNIHWVLGQADGEFLENGEFLGLIGTLTDITKRKRLEEQLRQSQKIEAVGHLAGGIAHEFNNLLQIILGFAQLGQETLPPSDPQAENYTMIQNASEKGAMLVKQLLAFSKQQNLEPKSFAFNQQVSSLMKLIQPMMGNRIMIIFSANTEQDNVRADPHTLEQILVNLCINARDAMPDGGRLTLESSNVMRTPEGSEVPIPYLQLKVQDTGMGIPPENLDKIFEPFFTTKGPQKGAGLGLSTVYGLVRQQNGMIEVQSEPGKGATFRLFLPIYAPSEPILEKTTGEGSGLILVAEDEAAVSMFVSRALKNEGFEVMITDNGKSALEQFRKNQDNIALVLLDVVMPEMSGREVYEAIRMENPEIPILFQTGYDPNEVENDFFTQENLRFLSKPYTPGQLISTIREMISGTHPLGR